MFDGFPVYPAPALGAAITPASDNTPHLWVADINGLYHAVTDRQSLTPVDLAAEWKGYYQTLLAGGSAAASLSPIQRLEGNAEAVFENTSLSTLSAADQARDREDAQREFDAMAAALTSNQANLGLNASVPLTEHAYIWLGLTIQDTPNLYELALQGHGLNDPAALRYNGYTNDFQNNVDTTTLFVGGGIDNNRNALADFFDDAIVSHTPFPVVVKNGNIVQLNQNAAQEQSLLNATVGLDDYMYGGVLIAKDFSATASCSIRNTFQTQLSAQVKLTAIDLTKGVVKGQISSLLGPVSATLAPQSTGGMTIHAWAARANGQFFTDTDLAAEWQGYYRMVLAGQGGSLTPVQRLEANAEAVFESTSLAQCDSNYLYLYRQDAQREFDVIDAALQIYAAGHHTSATAPLTDQTYLAIERIIQSNATLWELAVQGHGLNNPPAPRYRGYTNDFQNGVDGNTRYVGGELNNGRNALTDFFDDNILTHVVFPAVWQDGQVVQLNQNANRENILDKAVVAMNESVFFRFYVASDFRGPGCTA